MNTEELATHISKYIISEYNKMEMPTEYKRHWLYDQIHSGAIIEEAINEALREA